MEKEQHLSSKLSLKIFIGCIITPDLRLQLNESPDWQRLIAFPDSNTKDLKELHYQDKDYFGIFLKSSHPTLAEVKTTEKAIRSAIECFCPIANANSIKLFLFSQVFLA